MPPPRLVPCLFRAPSSIGRHPSPRRCLDGSPRLLTTRPAARRSIRTQINSYFPRTFSTSVIRTHPAPPIAPHASEPTPLSIDDYHNCADAYIDALVAELEELQEEREEVDVEYSAGVLTLVFPPSGTYVLNKQPPNRQIWLSSPISGPKRYDFVEDGTKGRWVYLRDGGTLTDLLKAELEMKLASVEEVEL